jgi:hypothetical protein
MFLEFEFRSLFHCMSSKGGTIIDSAHMHQCRNASELYRGSHNTLPKNYVPEYGLLFH